MSITLPPLNPEPVTALKRLKLGRIIDTLPDRLVLADKQDMSFDDVLLLVLTDEIAQFNPQATERVGRQVFQSPHRRRSGDERFQIPIGWKSLNVHVERAQIVGGSHAHERIEGSLPLGGVLVEQLGFDQSVPLFVIEDAQWNFDNFRKWFDKYKPDAVIGHEQVVLDWLRKLGAHVPDDVGFVHLNCADRSGPSSGIYQNGAAIGALAVDFLIGMVQRNERGVPALPHSLLVEGTWVQGKTVRAKKSLKMRT